MSEIVTNVIIVIVIFGLTTYINIKTKFAKDEREAMQHAKTLGLNLALIVACGWSAFRLFKDFSSPSPLDKKTLLFILINSFGLFYVVIGLHLRSLLRIFGKFLNLFTKLQCIKEDTTAQKPARPDKE